MRGRYIDELRRITREQGGAEESGGFSPASADTTGERRRRYASLLVLLLIVSLAGGGWLLVRQLLADAKLQDCVMSGRKNCAPAEITSGGR